MFEAFVITLIIVGWFVVLSILLWYAYDNNKIALVGVGLWCAIAVFFAVYMGMEESKRGSHVLHAPCIEWQTH